MVDATTSPSNIRRERPGHRFTFDGPAAAIVRRDVGRILQERVFRVIVVGLSIVNLAIAYTVYSDPLGMREPEVAVARILVSQWALLYSVGFIMTAVRAGTCIGTERARDTWEMMWLTPATPLSIALGHIASALAPALLLTLSQLPILAPIVYAIGPDEWPRMVAASAIGYTSWVACAVWAFWASAQFRDIGRALAGAFLAAFWSSGIATLMVVGTIVLFSSLADPNWNPSFAAAEFLRFASPVMVLYYLLEYGVLRVSVIPHMAFMLGSALIPLAMGARAIRRKANAERCLPHKSLPESSRRASRTPRFTRPLDIPDGMNPVFALERHIAATQRTRVGKWLFLSFSIVVIYLNYRTFEGRLIGENAVGLVVLSLVSLGIAAWVSASGIAASHERDTFDMLAMTGLEARDILLGKIVSAIAQVTPLVILIVACMTVAALVSGQAALAVACFTTFVVCIATLVSSGLFAVVSSRGIREAVVMNILFGVSIFFGIPILLSVAFYGFQSAVTLNWLGLQTWFTPPFHYSGLNQSFTEGSSPVVGFLQLSRNPGGPEEWRIWCAGVLTALAWTLLWYNMAKWMLQRRLAGRSVGWLESAPKE